MHKHKKKEITKRYLRSERGFWKFYWTPNKSSLATESTLVSINKKKINNQKINTTKCFCFNHRGVFKDYRFRTVKAINNYGKCYYTNKHLAFICISACHTTGYRGIPLEMQILTEEVWNGPEILYFLDLSAVIQILLIPGQDFEEQKSVMY